MDIGAIFNNGISMGKQLKSLREMIRVLPQTILLFDNHKVLLSIHNLSVDILDIYHLDSMIGRDVESFINDTNSFFSNLCRQINQKMDVTSATGKTERFQFKFDVYYCDAILSMVDQNYYFFQIQDVTKQVNKQKDIDLKNRQELARAFNLGGLVPFSYDTQTHLFTSMPDNSVIGASVYYEDLLLKVIPGHRKKIVKLFAEIEQKKESHAEATIQIADLKGNLRWVNVYIVPHEYNEEGSVKTIIGYQKDETRRIFYEKSRNQLLRLNDLIMNNSGAGFVYVTPDYKVAWENVSKVLMDEFVDDTCFYEVGELCYKNADKLKESYTRGFVEAAFELKATQRIQKYLPSGAYVEIAFIPVLSEDETVEGVVIKVEDISERKAYVEAIERSEESIRDNQNLLLAIMDNTPCPLFIKDADNDFRYVMANTLFCKLTGKTAEEIVGKTDYEVFASKEEADMYRNDDIRIIRNGKMESFEETRYNLKGEIEHYLTTKTPFWGVKGDKKLLIGIALDMTERITVQRELSEAKKKAEQSDALKTAFLANMSHEIRTPLNSIVGFSQLLGEVGQEEQKMYMDIIHSNSELLLKLINDILDLSKIESGYVEHNDTNFDLNDLFRELEIMILPKVHENVRLINRSTEKCIVHLDRFRVSQVMGNFLINAVKFTSHGSIEMGYEMREKGIVLYVKDSGCGIKEEDCVKVFDRFEKLDTFAQGTGLGMAICKGIADSYHGEIGVDSILNIGSKFWIYLPTSVEQEESQTNEAKETVMEKQKDKNDIHILIAEDNESNYLLMKALLREYKITWVKDGVDAVEAVRNHSYSLILMDIRMPIMDGLEATKRIRLFNFEVPIVAVTANAFDSDRKEALNAGCADFISKPLKKEKLLEILDKYVYRDVLRE